MTIFLCCSILFRSCNIVLLLGSVLINVIVRPFPGRSKSTLICFALFVTLSDGMHFKGLRLFHTYSVWSALYAVHVWYVWCRSSTGSLCLHIGHVSSLLMIWSCIQQMLPLSIILISNPHFVTENAFQHCNSQYTF